MTKFFKKNAGITVIQRIQTFFLFLIIPVNAGFLFTPMFHHVLQDPSGWLSNGLMAALLFSTGLSLYSVFLFRNRNHQMKWVKRAILFQIIAVGMNLGVFFTVGRLGKHLLVETFSIGLLVLGVIILYAALHFIHKDEQLVRSMDRIR